MLRMYSSSTTCSPVLWRSSASGRRRSLALLSCHRLTRTCCWSRPSWSSSSSAWRTGLSQARASSSSAQAWCYTGCSVPVASGTGLTVSWPSQGPCTACLSMSLPSPASLPLSSSPTGMGC
ncbi:NR4A1 isoform 10, partial [Pan troglodytes]